MNREIKFRIWLFIDKAFHYFDIYEGYPSGIAGGVGEPQQYTGLKDKNGKEIYEGDIVKLSDEWLKKSRGFGIFGPYGNIWRRFDGTWICSYNHLYSESCDPLAHIYPPAEVIGNIHENPELLK